MRVRLRRGRLDAARDVLDGNRRVLLWALREFAAVAPPAETQAEAEATISAVRQIVALATPSDRVARSPEAGSAGNVTSLNSAPAQ